MGAISSAASIPVLREYLTDHNRTVRETCEIALAKIEWDNTEEGKKHLAEKAASDATPFVYLGRTLSSRLLNALTSRTYTSIDPAPASSKLLAAQPCPEDVNDATISSLRHTLLDTGIPLFERYRAMFALRNIGTPSAVDALAAGFSDDSALFK